MGLHCATECGTESVGALDTVTLQSHVKELGLKVESLKLFTLAFSAAVSSL